MEAQAWGTYLIDQWHATTIWEIVAVSFSVAQVLLSYRNHVWLYPAGIVSCALFIGIMTRPSVGLYAESALYAYYLIMSIYGWYRWNRQSKDGKGKTPITQSSPRDWKIVIAIVLIAFITIYNILTRFTHSTVPIWDGLVSATAWAGMWLLAQKKLENWIVLNVSNAIAVPLLFYKGLPLTALLTLFLFIVAVLGYFHWKKIMNVENRASLGLSEPVP